MLTGTTMPDKTPLVNPALRRGIFLSLGEDYRLKPENDSVLPAIRHAVVPAIRHIVIPAPGRGNLFKILPTDF